MEPAEFLSPTEFGDLSEDDRAAYANRFFRSFLETAKSADVTTEERLSYLKHYGEVCGWTMTPEEFETKVRLPMWELASENAEEIATSMEGYETAPDLTDEQRAWIGGVLEPFVAISEHKKGLAEWPTRDAD